MQTNGTIVLSEFPTIHEQLTVCVSETGVARAFIVVERRRGERMALSTLATSPEGGQSPRLTFALRWAVHSAAQSGRPVLLVNPGPPATLQPFSGEVIIAAPIGRGGEWGRRGPKSRCVLVALGRQPASYAGLVDAIERHARLLAPAFLIEARPAWEDTDAVDGPVSPAALPAARRVDVLLHELRTPLGAAEYAVEKLAAARLDARQQGVAPLVETLRTAIDEARGILRHFGQISLLDAGAGNALSAVPVDEVIERALTLLPSARSHSRVIMPAGVPLVTADDLRLTQALINLIENAVKHTQASAPIEVEVKPRSGGQVMISITSHGAGIAIQDQQAIFRPYQHSALANDLASKGLGLSIAKQLVQSMGGDLWVESNGQDVTTISIALRMQGQDTAQDTTQDTA